jgi:hypothetical protein
MTTSAGDDRQAQQPPSPHTLRRQVDAVVLVPDRRAAGDYVIETKAGSVTTMELVTVKSNFKGTVQRDLTWVTNFISRKSFLKDYPLVFFLYSISFSHHFAY